MFGIGVPEMIMILAVALIVIGPKRLPEVARYLGKAMGEFKRAAGELKRAVDIGDELSDVKNTFHDMKEKVWEAADTVQYPSSAADQAPPGLEDRTGTDGQPGENPEPETEKKEPDNV